jgi:hypothetical protein
MQREQRLKYEMFVRVKNFGVANREAFPEESGPGKKFGQAAPDAWAAVLARVRSRAG